MNDSPTITDSVEVAAEALLAGRLVAVPTETVYGLAADAGNLDAVRAVFTLKGRPLDHPLIVHCADAQHAWRCVERRNDAADRLADAFWPGPMTLVLPRGAAVDASITAGQDSVAVRVPGHPLTRQLLLEIDRPIVAPSANRFGRVSPTRAQHVAEEFPDAALLILDGGSCEVGIESTIVDCRDGERVSILRPGMVTPGDIQAVLGDRLVLGDQVDSKSLKVSGNLPAHYAPAARVVLVEADDLDEWLRKSRDVAEQIMVISSQTEPSVAPANVVWHRFVTDQQLARELYSYFRMADRTGCKRIVVELPAQQGIGIALRDRLNRAAFDKG